MLPLFLAFLNAKLTSEAAVSLIIALVPTILTGNTWESAERNLYIRENKCWIMYSIIEYDLNGSVEIGNELSIFFQVTVFIIVININSNGVSFATISIKFNPWQKKAWFSISLLSAYQSTLKTAVSTFQLFLCDRLWLLLNIFIFLIVRALCKPWYIALAHKSTLGTALRQVAVGFFFVSIRYCVPLSETRAMNKALDQLPLNFW